MEWMQSANAKLANTSVSTKGPFGVVPQLVYSKTIAKSDKSLCDTS